MTSTIDAVPNFKFGCDPEFFIVDAEGKPVAASNFLTGTKKEPTKCQFGAYQVDGLAAEINIEPAESFQDFNRNIDAVIGQVKALIPKGYSLSRKPAITFEPAVFGAAPPKCLELGCDPDYDAWTGEKNLPPNTDATPYLRTAAGHIHVGWEDCMEVDDAQHIVNCRHLVQQLDWYLGAWSLTKDLDPTRRLLYGKAGACRYKPYGVEYRVLSNFWIWTVPGRREVWNRTQLAIKGMARSFMPQSVPKSHNEALVASINASVRSSSLERRYYYPMVSLNH